MAKTIIPARGFTKGQFSEAPLTHFMGWDRLMGLIIDAEEKTNEKVVGFEIEDDGITIHFKHDKK